VADTTVVVQEFASEAEGRIAAAVLDANGVQAQVLTNMSVYPGVASLSSVRLIVRAADAAKARELLAAAE